MKFPKGIRYNRLKFALGEGLVTSTGDLWKSHRSLLNPSFHFAAVQSMTRNFNEIAMSLIDQWSNSNNSIVNMNLDLTALTAKIICKVAFGYDYTLNELKSTDLNTLLDEVVYRLGASFEWQLSFRSFFFPGQQKLVTETMARFDKLLDRIISERIRSRELSQDIQKEPECAKDLLDVLLMASEGIVPASVSEKSYMDNLNDNVSVSSKSCSESNYTSSFSGINDKVSSSKNISGRNHSVATKQLSKADLHDHCMTFLAAGHETTSSTLLWVILELCRHPEEMKKCHEDIDKVLQMKCARNISDAHINAFTYLPLVIKETMRLNPSVTMMSRNAVDGCNLGEYKVHPGTTIVIMLYTLHRHPEFWSNPDEFNPMRFSPENVKDTL
jgi:cytochrome P450